MKTLKGLKLPVINADSNKECCWRPILDELICDNRAVRVIVLSEPVTQVYILSYSEADKLIERQEEISKLPSLVDRLNMLSKG